MDKKIRKTIPWFLILTIIGLMAGLNFWTSEVKADQASSGASVGNSLPTCVDAVTITDVAGHITLTTNSTKEVSVSIEVTDNNGCEEVDEDEKLTGKIYKTTATDACSLDNNDCYTLTCTYTAESCTVGGTDLAASFTCTANLEYYADPAEWTAKLTPEDGTGSGTAGTDTTTVDTLTGLELKDVTIAYGELALGTNTDTTNQNTTVSNAGNEQIDVQLDGYGAEDGDGKAMTCTIGTVTIGNEKYLAEAFDYDTAGTALSDTAATLQMDIAQRTNDVDETAEDEEVYWGFGLPADGVGGSCTGKVNFTAISDS